MINKIKSGMVMGVDGLMSILRLIYQKGCPTLV